MTIKLTIQELGIIITIIVAAIIPGMIFLFKVLLAHLGRELRKSFDKIYMTKKECEVQHRVNNLMLKTVHDKIETTEIMVRKVLDVLLTDKKHKRA